MTLHWLDAIIILIPLALFIVLGFYHKSRASKNEGEYFLSGRQLPWWLLGISMVATTFSADTPNLVTDIVRQRGVSGNWVWWAFLLTGMLTVFFYAKLWRRSDMVTDLEFYELRYGGKKAAFLRGFRALYLGFFFNVVIMAGVMLAAVKIMSIMMGWSSFQTLLISGTVVLLYSSLGGLRTIIYTDLIQFLIAMVGTIWAAYYILNLPEIGGLGNLLRDENVKPALSFLPDFSDPSELWIVFIIPIAVQWWSVWYPGSEPGGGGYIAQRMLAAKNERQAMYATLVFNFAHYALRPWPWILIALASISLYPSLADIEAAFPNVEKSVLGDDLAYPAMLSLLPTGLLGLILLSLISAFMSTISTHLNWGASYIAHDFYGRFLAPESIGRERVWVGRLSTLLLMICAACLALFLENALSAFEILLQIGAGTGLIFILRWFWWRINAYSEISAMIVSFIIAIIFETIPFFDSWTADIKLIVGVFFTTLSWLIITLGTSPEKPSVLYNFLVKVKPHRWGWKPLIKANNWDEASFQSGESIGQQVAGFFLGILAIYSLLFATGYALYGEWIAFVVCIAVLLPAGFGLFRIISDQFSKIK
ncbi:MAG: Na+:solute symporter [Bacteroidetes bacterium]|jgi:Na+/proline symporter|nr:Na+:solute symporter [Bacteroidota bacterium]